MTFTEEAQPPDPLFRVLPDPTGLAVLFVAEQLGRVGLRRLLLIRLFQHATISWVAVTSFSPGLSRRVCGTYQRVP